MYMYVMPSVWIRLASQKQRSPSRIWGPADLGNFISFFRKEQGVYRRFDTHFCVPGIDRGIWKQEFQIFSPQIGPGNPKKVMRYVLQPHLAAIDIPGGGQFWGVGCTVPGCTGVKHRRIKITPHAGLYSILCVTEPAIIQGNRFLYRWCPR